MFNINYQDHSKLEKLLIDDQNVENFVDLNNFYTKGLCETQLSIYFTKNESYNGKGGLFSYFFKDETLEMNKNQYLSFPCVESQLKNIIQIYGKLINENEWSIDSKHFEVGKGIKSSFDLKIKTILNKIKKEFGIYNDELVKASIESMTISTKNNFQSPQLIPGDKSDLFGVLYLVLPSDYSGGELIVESIKQGNEWVKKLIPLENHNPSDIKFIALSKNSLYQFKPIVNGYRVMLKYNLYKTKKRSSPSSPSSPSSVSSSQSLNSRDIQDFDFTPNKKQNINKENQDNIEYDEENEINENNENNENNKSIILNGLNNKDGEEVEEQNENIKSINNVLAGDEYKEKIKIVLKHVHSILDEIDNSLTNIKSNFLIYALPENGQNYTSFSQFEGQDKVVLNNLLAARMAEQKLKKFNIYFGDLMIKVQHSGTFRNNGKSFTSSKIDSSKMCLTNLKDLSGNNVDKKITNLKHLKELLPKDSLKNLKPCNKKDNIEEKKQILYFIKKVILLIQPVE